MRKFSEIPDYLRAAQDLLMPGFVGATRDPSITESNIKVDDGADKLVMEVRGQNGHVESAEISGAEIKDESFKAAFSPRLREIVTKLGADPDYGRDK